MINDTYLKTGKNETTNAKKKEETKLSVFS